MIISKLMGGLGNQMFQYAAGLSLALHKKTVCKVDPTFLYVDAEGRYTKRNYELDIFKGQIDTVSEDEVTYFLKKYNSKLQRKMHSLMPVLFKNYYMQENGFEFHPELFELPSNAFISGYWQSEKYLSKYREQIRQAFTIKEDLLVGTDKIKIHMNASNSVALHVRRGDYVNNEVHGLCNLDYYKAAVQFLLPKINDLEVFVFSDDLEWCKQNLDLDVSTHMVDTGSPYKDLYLMQQCKHNIIANSSYSWWGAWLNGNADKIVIAPKVWFQTNAINAKDVICEDWVAI